MKGYTMDDQGKAVAIICTKPPPGFVVLTIQESDLRKLLQRALNTWADAPKHLIALADELGD
jgi:hypothetical protein